MCDERTPLTRHDGFKIFIVEHFLSCKKDDGTYFIEWQAPEVDPAILHPAWVELGVKNEIFLGCSFTKAFQQYRLRVSPGIKSLTLEMPDSLDLSSFTNFFVDFLQNAQNLLSHFLGRNVPNSFVRQSSWMLQYVSHSDELIAINFWDAAKLMEVAEYEQEDQNDNDNDNQNDNDNHNHNHNHNYQLLRWQWWRICQNH